MAVKDIPAGPELIIDLTVYLNQMNSNLKIMFTLFKKKEATSLEITSFVFINLFYFPAFFT